MRLRPLFYAWLSLCAGLTTVAIGGVRAVAEVIGMPDIATADRAGIVASLAVAAVLLIEGFRPDAPRD